MILKKLISIVASAVMCLVSINSVYAFEASDDPSISICKTEFNDLYEIEYPKVEKDKINSSYEKDVKNGIRLIMFNGSFVKDPGTVIQDETVYISLQKFAYMTGAEVAINRGQSVSININYNGQTLFVKSYSNTDAVLNDKSISMPRRFEMVLDDYYIPLRFICEVFGGEVNYYADYIYNFQHDVRDDVPSINIIAISMDQDRRVAYSIQEAENIIKIASLEKYDQIIEGLKERNIPDYKNKSIYDPNAIRYTGYDLDRYYVFELKGYESLPILFNKYTGELYSHKAGRSFIIIDEGFININWLL